MKQKIFRKRFERLANKLSKINKYHIHRSISIDDKGNLYYSRWDIYELLDNGPLYFSNENRPILSSEYGHTLKDIKQLIREENIDEFIQHFIPRK